MEEKETISILMLSQSKKAKFSLDKTLKQIVTFASFAPFISFIFSLNLRSNTVYYCLQEAFFGPGF